MSRVAYSCKSLAYPIVSSAFYLLVSYILKANRSLFSSLYKTTERISELSRELEQSIT